jgi:putative oxidoreductase
MKLGITILRAAVGGVFFAHGAQKLFGWFGGPGPDGMGKGFEQMGIRPGKRKAVIAGTAEAGGGALLAAGLMVPLGAAAVAGVMHQAVRSVHWQKGFFATQGGYEYNLVLAAAAVALADTGPGPWSLDRAVGIEMSGPAWALAALGAGYAGPLLLERAVRPAEEPPAAQTEPQRFVRDTEPAPAQPATAR